MITKESREHPLLTLSEIVQSAAKTGKKIYVLSPWAKWELDAFWSDKEAFEYYLSHYNDRFLYLYGNADYMTIQRKDETI